MRLIAEVIARHIAGVGPRGRGLKNEEAEQTGGCDQPPLGSVAKYVHAVEYGRREVAGIIIVMNRLISGCASRCLSMP